LPISEIPEIPVKPYRRNSHGKLSKLCIGEFLCLLFHYNEELDYPHKRNDEQLRDILLKEFGDRKGFAKLASRKENVGYYRSLYNLGTLTRRKVRKDIHGKVVSVDTKIRPGDVESQWYKSYRYDSNGCVINPRNGEPYADQEKLKQDIEAAKDRQPKPSGKDPLKIKRKKSNGKNSGASKKSRRNSVEDGTLE
jgi:hypothetical protein